MDEAHGIQAEIFLSGTVLLAASLLFVLLFRRLGLGAVLGYLIAGVTVGPFGLGLIKEAESILAFAEIGIVLLLFLVGLELAPRRLWRLKGDIFGLGLAQVTLCAVALIGLVMLATDISIGAAIALGMGLALSSTAQVLPLLQSAGRLNTPAGERAFSILLFQDLSIVPLLTIVAALSRAPGAANAPPGWLLGLYAVGGIGALVAIGHFLLVPLLKLVGRIAERELFIVVGLLAVLGGAALMSSLGLSPALGAFIAGVMLADSPFRHELEADIDPFRSILLGLFFLAVGMMLDVNTILARPVFVIFMALALVAVKVVIIFGLARLFGVASRSAFILGLLLSQGGEFAFVLFAAAQRGLIIAPDAASLFGAIVTLSMVTTPFLMLIGQRLGGIKSSVTTEPEGPKGSTRGGVIIVGHGRFGQSVNQIFAAANFPLTIIDINPSTIQLSGEYGRKVFYGDGTRPDLLRQAGAEQAEAIVFCMDDAEFHGERVTQIATAFPNARLFVRARDRRQALALMDSPVHGVVREVYYSAVSLACHSLRDLGLDSATVDRVVDEFKRRDVERLSVQHSEGDMRAGMNHSFGIAASDDFVAQPEK